MAIQAITAVLFSTFFIGLSLLLVYCWRWRRYFELGMKLPGPPALPLLGNCLDFTTKNLCNFFQEFTEFSRTYVPVARLWFGPVLVVVLSDPNHIEKVVQHDKIGNKGYLIMKCFEPAFRNGLFVIDGDKWREHRKIITSALNKNVLETFVENFAKNSDILANKLKAVADGTTAQDIVPYFTRCTLDIILQTSLRIHINAQEGKDNDILNAITNIAETIAVRGMKPWLYIDLLFNLTKLGTKFHNSVKHCHDTINNVILRKKSMIEAADKKDLHHEEPSLMDILLHYGEMNKEDIVGEITTIVGAGTETTSKACCYVLALLAENQHIQETVIQEQEDIFSDDMLRPVRSEDLPRMVYLEQVGN
jgi:cytochrome P450 family 4